MRRNNGESFRQRKPARIIQALSLVIDDGYDTEEGRFIPENEDDLIKAMRDFIVDSTITDAEIKSVLRGVVLTEVLMIFGKEFKSGT